MKKTIFLIVFLSFLLIPSFARAFWGCNNQIMPCGYDVDGDGTVEYETLETGNLNRQQEIAGGFPESIDYEGCRFVDIFVLVNNIIVFVMTCLAPLVSGVMLILGSFYLMIAGVDQNKLKTGKDIMTAAVAGLIFIFISWVLLNTFLTMMGVAEWTGLREGWWEF